MLNKIMENSKPTQDVQIKFYTTTLPLPISMFVKRVGKVTLMKQPKQRGNSRVKEKKGIINTNNPMQFIK